MYCLDGHSSFLFISLDLLTIAWLDCLVIKSLWFPVIISLFSGDAYLILIWKLTNILNTFIIGFVHFDLNYFMVYFFSWNSFGMRSKEYVIDLWKPIIPVSPIAVLWKLLVLFERSTSMEVANKGVKHVLLLIRFAMKKVSHKSER